MLSMESQTQPHEDWLTISEACAVLKVSRETLRQWMRSGKITFGRTPGGRPRIARSEIDKTLEGLNGKDSNGS